MNQHLQNLNQTTTLNRKPLFTILIVTLSVILTVASSVFLLRSQSTHIANKSQLKTNTRFSLDEATKLIEKETSIKFDPKAQFLNFEMIGLIEVAQFRISPEVFIIRFSSADSLDANIDTFKKDFSYLYGEWKWNSCENIIIVHAPRFHDDVINALSPYCNFE